MLSEPSAIVNSAIKFYKGFLAGGDGQFQMADFDFIPTLVTEEDDADLCRVPNMEEICQVVFSIDRDGAPGPDGFCGKFYQM